MRFDSYSAGYNAYPYLSLYSGMVVFFADTGIPRYGLHSDSGGLAALGPEAQDRLRVLDLVKAHENEYCKNRN